MNTNDTIAMSRPVTKYFLNVVSIIISSVGFIHSVIAHCIAILLPSTQRRPEPTIIRAPVASPTLSESDEESADIVFSLFRMDSQTPEPSVPIAVRRRHRGLSDPTMATACPPATASMVVLTGNAEWYSSPGAVESYFAAAEIVCPSDEILGSPQSAASSAQSPDLSRKSPLLKRLPTLFRKGRTSDEIEKEANRPHTPNASSPPRRTPSPVAIVRALTKREPSEPADAHGRIPYVPVPEEVTMLRTTFVNPFKPKRKTPPVSPVSTPQPKVSSLPPTAECASPSQNHRRHRSLVTFLHSAVRPSLHTSTADSRSSSPHRGSFSSYSTTSSSSSCASSSAPASRRSFSFSSTSGEYERENAKRTQPYGPPYYAAMPVPRPERSSSRTARASVKPIKEDSEPEQGALGLSLAAR